MALIRRHLVANLSIDKEDFDLVPVLSDRGGWVPANKAFGGQPGRTSRIPEQGVGSRMNDVVAKLWGFCHTLRHDGVDYGDYIEQLTYLLFLKMADERGNRSSRKGRLAVSTEAERYRASRRSTSKALRILGRQPGILGDIYSGAQNRFTNPVNLQKLVGLIDETEWTSLDVDVKAAVFEGLLEKAASEGKKGAGQYFTPRVLIQSHGALHAVPIRGSSKDFAIGDPACGTGGFLIAAYEWLKDETGGAFGRELAKRVRQSTYFGQELVARPRRLALMNMYLHQVEPHISSHRFHLRDATGSAL